MQTGFPFVFMLPPKNNDMDIDTLKRTVLAGGSITTEEAAWLALHAEKDALYEASHEITLRCMGGKFDLCSIINAKSGNCCEDCKWCAQSAKYRTAAAVYPLLPAEECVAMAVHNSSKGVRRFALVTSGKRVSRQEITRIAGIFRRIRQSCPIHCCASMGLLGREELQLLFDAGVENYHCNIETAPSFFPSLCSTHTQGQKFATLRAAREIGFRLCSGGIIGMGETMLQRIEMATVLRGEGILSIPLNILQPIPGTPLENAAPLTEDELLTTIAVFRWLNPHAFLRFSGGRKLLPGNVQRRALYVGINSAITGELLTTEGGAIDSDCRMITDAGYSLRENTDW